MYFVALCSHRLQLLQQFHTRQVPNNLLNVRVLFAFEPGLVCYEILCFRKRFFVLVVLLLTVPLLLFLGRVCMPLV